jgi:uncharacterized membrane protein
MIIKKNTVHIVLLLTALSASAYLTYLGFAQSSSICDINDTFSCSAVSSSEYGEFLGIPTALFGLAFVFTNIALFILTNKSLKIDSLLRDIRLFLNTVAAMFALLLIYLQAFEIGAWCVFCIIFDTATLIYTGYLYSQKLRTKKS